jgi:AcrR family transcriptional regulator
MARLTRAEQRERTRGALLEAAAEVFARRGLQRASIDEVAETAGYTKGAFYANFKSKEELFLAMLDERFAERLEVIERLLGGEGPLEARAKAIGLDFDRTVLADAEWQRLFFEFATYAARDAGFHEELLTRYRALRARITDVHRRRADELGVEPVLPLEEITLMTCAMAHGAGLERLLSPEDVPDDLYGKMLEVFTAGLRALSGAASSA